MFQYPKWFGEIDNTLPLLYYGESATVFFKKGVGGAWHPPYASGSCHTISQLCGELDRSHGATLHLTLDLASRAQVIAASRPSWLGANQRTNSSRPVADLTSTKYLAWNLITKKSYNSLSKDASF